VPVLLSKRGRMCVLPAGPSLTAQLWVGLVSLDSGGLGDQKLRNFAPLGFSALHDGHRRANGDAHSTQNFARSGFSTPHFAQRIAPSARALRS